MRRLIRNSNSQPVLAQINGPDAFATQAASLGLATLTYSPMSAGVHSPGASPRGFVGDRGYGVNRWAGRTPYPVQQFQYPPAPIADPMSQRLGIGAGVAGQPGLPNTGTATGGLSSLALLSFNPLGRPGLGV